MSRDTDVFEDDRTFLNIIATMSNWDVDKLRKVLVLFSFCSRHEQKPPRIGGFSKNVGEKCKISILRRTDIDKTDGKLLFKSRLVTVFVKMCGYFLNTFFFRQEMELLKRVAKNTILEKNLYSFCCKRKLTSYYANYEKN